MGTRVYMGKISYHVRERDIERFFKGYGRIREVMLKNGFGFVEFDDYRDADDAIYELNGKELCGERVLLEPARGTPRGPGGRPIGGFGGGGGGYGGGGYGGGGYGGGGGGYGGDRGRRRPVWLDKYGPPTRTDYRVRIENLSTRISWQDLKDFMRQAGEVTYADAHKSERNVGVVEFSSRTDMKNAIDKLDGTELNGRKIKMIVEKSSSSSRRSRSYSRSRSRSRSRRRTHTRSRSRSASRSRSRTPPKEGSRSRSGSAPRNEKNRSPSKSPARSHTPEQNNEHEEEQD